MKDLLRFYNPEPLDELKEIDYLYRDQLDVLEEEPKKETSLIEQRDGESTVDLYETDAPEIQESGNGALDEYSDSPGQPE